MNTNKYAKVSDYNGRNLCKMSKMTAGIEVVEESNFYKDKAITFKDVIAAFIKGELESTDTQDVIEAALEGCIDGPEKTESQIIKADTKVIHPPYFATKDRTGISSQPIAINTAPKIIPAIPVLFISGCAGGHTISIFFSNQHFYFNIIINFVFKFFTHTYISSN